MAAVNDAAGRLRRSLLAGITRNVVMLGLVSLLTDISSELLVFLIPLFLANVLSAAPTVIGIVEGVTESAAAFLKFGSGWLSDRAARRKPLVVAGYATSTVAKAFYFFAAAWPVVLLARLGDRVGKGIRTSPRDALIADSTTPEARGRAFGLHRAMDTAGATLGVAIAAVVVTVMQGDALTLAGDTWRAIVLIAIVPAVLAVGVGIAGVRDVARRGPKHEAGAGGCGRVVERHRRPRRNLFRPPSGGSSPPTSASRSATRPTPS